MSGTAAARPNQRTQVSAALAKERYYSSHRAPQTLAAQPGKSQGRPMNSPGSKPIVHRFVGAAASA